MLNKSIKAMTHEELKNKIESFKKDSYYNDFQIITSLNMWNDSSIWWNWGTDADDGDENDEYTVEVNFTDSGNVHITLVPTKERISGSVSHDADWPVDELEDMYNDLIENAEIFGEGRF